MEQSPRTVERARALRRSPTAAERKLWGYLRKERLGGFKFRRQAPVPPYIADFLCLSHKLIVEIDGATHGDAHQVQYDESRTAFLASKGFRVLRFWNNDVYEAMDAVLDSILLSLQQRDRHKDPLPPFGHLPPMGEG